jgi:hypothetical protein
MAKRPKADPQAEEIARLYSLPLDDFTAERDTAAKRLRADGDADGAKRIKALRKPNVPAAAINRAVRAEPGAARELIEAGERLEAAQSKALAGKGADAMREASAQHIDAVERLMKAVVAELAGAGGSSAVDRARETLRAVAVDDDLRAELTTGTLVRDGESAGLGGVGAVDVIAPSAPRKKTAKKVGAAPKAEGKGKAKSKPAGPTAAQRKRAKQAVQRAERAVEAAESRVQDTERRLERARRAVAEAKDDDKDARRELKAREAELAEAQAAADRL